MLNTITCPKCGTQIEITQALKKDLEQKVLEQSNAKHQAEIAKLKQAQDAKLKQTQSELERSKLEIAQKARQNAIKKVRQEYDAKIESTKMEAKDAEKQNKELQSQSIKLMEQLRAEKNEKSKMELEYKKKLMAEEENIKQKAKKEADHRMAEEHRRGKLSHESTQCHLIDLR